MGPRYVMEEGANIVGRCYLKGPTLNHKVNAKVRGGANIIKGPRFNGGRYTNLDGR